MLRAIPLIALALLAAGCVSLSRYEVVENERDMLQERVDLLERSTESLDNERVKLIDQLETLRQERERLDAETKKLSRTSAELNQKLEAREQELAARTTEIGTLKGTYDSLVEDLESEVASGKIQIEQLREGLRLAVSDEILFDSGSAQLNAQGQDVLRRVANQLAQSEHRVEVQGHTDGVPIRGALAQRFASNWELGGARAAGVTRLLAESGVDATRLSAVSFGDQHPVAPNDSPEGRQRNRRIEIRLLPDAQPATAAAGQEPAAGAPAP